MNVKQHTHKHAKELQGNSTKCYKLLLLLL